METLQEYLEKQVDYYEKLPKEMSGIFIEFFKKVDEYEDKN